MNLFNLIEEIEKVDPEVHERMSPRRDAIKNITSFGSKVAVAALPFAFSTIFRKAYSQTTPAQVNSVLNFALQLEYLESYFYNQGMASAGLIAAVDVPSFAVIQSQENAHVAFLKSMLGSAAISMPIIDLTGKGMFANVLTDYPTFMAVANVFEDTGIRAYKGQLPNLIGNQTVLTAMLSIHAVEARHASAVRQIRASHGVTITPWITGSATVYNDTGVPAANPNYGIGGLNYASENNISQGGVDVTKLASVSGSTTAYNVACEAFDEPMDMNVVLNILSPFFG